MTGEYENTDIERSLQTLNLGLIKFPTLKIRQKTLKKSPREMPMSKSTRKSRDKGDVENYLTSR